MLSNWIFLYGPPGSGKSTLGRKLARALNLPFLDLDKEVEKANSASIPELFSAQGEAGFRLSERQALLNLLAGQPGVVALGGGTLLDEDNRQRVDACGPVVCLNASRPVLVKQLLTSADRRPLLVGDLEHKLDRLLEQRSAHYASFPLRVDVGDRSLGSTCWRIQRQLGRFYVKCMGEVQDARLAKGLLGELGAGLIQHGLRVPVVVVADENVASLYSHAALSSLEKAGLSGALVTFPAGEQHKNLDTLRSVWQAFLRAGMERGGTVVALGGGVTCDLAGFAAATYMRGVTWVAIPTSLLAMVDASLGGKTGIDLPRGKNLVGAFHLPRLVLADPQLLSTLPEDEIRYGMAEVVKVGVIGDPQLFRACSDGIPDLPGDILEIISCAMAVKIRLVQQDPYEHGPRAALNLGHTIGHAIERLSRYQITHGEAVAIGLVAEARLAEGIGLARTGIAGQIKSTLESLGLPMEIPDWVTPGALLNAMQVDKKRAAGDLRFSLPVTIGKVRPGIPIPPKAIISILKHHRG